MISFLNPLFLMALAGAVAPLLLHLMQRRQSSRMPFSTIRFLVLAQKRSSSRIRMQHWLLWLLRTLLLIFLALAFAMPMLRTAGFGNLLGQAGRDIAIVLDSSYSMNYLKGGTPVWSEAIDSAAGIIEGLGNRDRVCIYLAEQDPVPIVEQLSGDLDQAVALLRNRKHPGLGTSNLLLAFAAAGESLAKAERRREREIHIITDNQALPWNETVPVPGETASDPDDPRAARRTLELENPASVFVTLLGVETPQNVAPADLSISPSLVRPDSPLTLDVTLVNNGLSRDSVATLFVNGKEVTGRAMKLETPGRHRLRLSLPPLGAGTHVLSIETPDDNLDIDNRFHALVEVSESLPALCIGTAEDTFYVRAALATGERHGSGIETRLIHSSLLQEQSLSGSACLFLCNALPLGGQDILKIERYVRSGGLLVLFPGDGASPQDYAAWDILPGIPSRIVSLPRSERRRSLQWREPSHTLLREFATEGISPEVVIRRELRWDALPEETSILVTAGPQHPFMLLRQIGLGHVILFSVTADRNWSEFPLSAFFLPMVHQAALFGAGAAGRPAYLTGQETVDLERYLPGISATDILRDPESRRVPLRISQTEGRRVFDVGILRVPGIYTLSSSETPTPVPALAVNLPREESDLSPVVPENIPDILGIDSATLSGSLEELERRIEEHRIGRTFGEHLLWLALIIAVIEFFYANRLFKSAPKLSDSLKVEFSGKVGGSGIGGASS